MIGHFKLTLTISAFLYGQSGWFSTSLDSLPPCDGCVSNGRLPRFTTRMSRERSSLTGFLSDEQYKTFYWPYLKKILLGLIDEGIAPFVWAEGGSNSRLEVIRDLPKGKTIWLFDEVDMI